MSLKAKLEAVIYAAEEPVTLTQLAALFAADALEWKAAQVAAAAEQVSEVAGEPDNAPMTLLDEELATLGIGDATVSDSETAPQPDTADAPETEAQALAPSETTEAAGEEAPPDEPEAESGNSAGEEAETKRLARQRDRDVKTTLKQLLDELVAECAADGRGVEIREIAGGYRMATKPECHDAVRLFVKSLKPVLKLSLAALETLAVVAYKQPVTAPEVSEIRGVEAAGVLGSLLARKLIATAGRKAVIGRPILYKTTKEFLLRFGLKDVSELPSMDEFEKMAAIEIEEEMEPEAAAADAAEDAADESAAEPGDEESGELFDTQDAVDSQNGDGTAAGSDAAVPAADLTAARPAEPDAPSNPTEAAPAEPESTLQAEIETSPHGQEEQEER